MNSTLTINTLTNAKELANFTKKELQAIAEKNFGMKLHINTKAENMISKIVDLAKAINLGTNQNVKPASLFSSIKSNDPKVPTWDLERVIRRMDVAGFSPNFETNKPISQLRVADDSVLSVLDTNLEQKYVTVREIFNIALATEKLVEKANEEAKKTKVKNVTYNSEFEKQILMQINAEREENKKKLEEAQFIMEQTRLKEQEAKANMINEIIQNETLTVTSFEDKLSQLQIISDYCIEKLWERVKLLDSQAMKLYIATVEAKNTKDNLKIRDTQKEYQDFQRDMPSFVDMLNSNAKLIAKIIDNSFNKDELFTKDNFEKRTEYDALIDATLIKAGLFDYKTKDSELLDSMEIAKFLIDEARNKNIMSDIHYHAKNIKKEDAFHEKVSERTGAVYQLLYRPTERQLNRINRIILSYFRTHGQMPSLPVQYTKDITSSTLANAIMKKYREYLEMEAPASEKQMNELFDIFKKWGIAKEESRIGWTKNARLRTSANEAYQYKVFVRSNMYLIKSFMSEHNLKVLEAIKKLITFNPETLLLLKTRYAKKVEQQYEVQWFTFQDDK